MVVLLYVIHDTISPVVYETLSEEGQLVELPSLSVVIHQRAEVN
jgi:hypothetical protein